MKILKTDIIMSLAITFWLGAFICTRIFLTSAQHICGRVEAVATALEANPMVVMVINLAGIRNMIIFLVAPAMMIALYWFARTLYLKKKLPLDFFMMLVIFFMIIFAVDFLNDLSILIGLFI